MVCARDECKFRLIWRIVCASGLCEIFDWRLVKLFCAVCAGVFLSLLSYDICEFNNCCKGVVLKISILAESYGACVRNGTSYSSTGVLPRGNLFCGI